MRTRRDTFFIGLRVGLLTFGLFGCDRAPSQPTTAGSNQQAAQDITSAYDPGADPPSADGVDDAATAQAVWQVQTMFDEVASDMAASRFAQATARIDADRLIQELASRGVLDKIRGTGRTQFNQGVTTSLQVAQGNIFQTGGEYEVRSLRLLPGGEAVAYTRLVSEFDTVVKTRWWLTSDGTRWRVFDWEDLDMSMRATALMAVTMRAILDGGRMPRWTKEFERFQEASSHLGNEQWAQGQAVLETMRLSGAPDEFLALKWFLLASCYIGQGLNEEALDAIEKADQLNPGAPILLFQRAGISFDQGEYDQALGYIAEYQSLLGGDMDMYMLQMLALDGLGRYEEAVAAGRLMVEDGKDAVSIAEFGLILSEQDKPQIADLIVEFGITPEGFETIADYYYESDDMPALRAAVQGFKRVDPTADDTVYYDALAMYVDGEYARAAEILKPVIDRLRDPDYRQPFLDIYWESMRLSGEALQAYTEADDPAKAFAAMAQQLYWADELQTLDALARAHTARLGTDPWGHYYVGLCLAGGGDWGAADRSFQRAASLAENDEDLADIRYDWVDSLAGAGQWRLALDRVGGSEEAIDQLMWFHINQKDSDALDELLTAYLPTAPSIGRAYVYSLRGAHQAAAEYLASHREALQTQEMRYSFDDLVIRSLIRAELFAEALKWARESTEFDDDPYYEMVVHVASGDSDEAIAVAKKCIDSGNYTPPDFYNDLIVQEHVFRQRMKRFREAFPPPVDSESTDTPSTPGISDTVESDVPVEPS
jgi:tetratricopeptide (TPR) repeat protein